VLLLMLDGCDWPVAFLGAMYAGVVPVAVNTLLTADDYAYMLEHSRAQAVLVSGALLPALTAAMVKSDHEVGKVIVSRPQAPLHPSEVAFDSLRRRTRAGAARPAATGPDDPGFWLYSSGSTGRPKGAVHSHGNPYWTSELYGAGVLRLRGRRCLLLGRQAVLRLRPGQCADLPDERGRHHAADGRAARRQRLSSNVGAARSAGSSRPCSSAPPPALPACWPHPNLPARHEVALRLVSSAGEALPAEIGERFKAHFGTDIVDGIGSTEMLHIFISNLPGRVRYGSTGWVVPGYEIELRGEDGKPVPDGEIGDLYIQGPSAAMMYWGNRSKTRETFQGGWTKAGDKYVKNADGSYTYSGRSDDMLKVSGIYVSPFEVEATLVQHPRCWKRP
jgi:benzoate-CoA ligase